MRLFVGDNQVRVEYRHNELEVVEIYDMANQRVLLLVPKQKLYMQRALPPGEVINPMLAPRDNNPCAAIAQGQCEKLGSETLYGRSVSKWQVTVVAQGKTLRSLHWIDDQRLMSLRDAWPDGSVSELTLQDSAAREGRITERWERVTAHPDGKKEITKQWYDPELKIAVREERPGGFVREITHIRIAKQAAALFQVPAGYRLVENNAPQHE